MKTLLIPVLSLLICSCGRDDKGRDVEELNSELDRINYDLSIVKQQLARTKHEKITAESKVSALQTENEILQREKNDLTRKVEATEQRFQSMRDLALEATELAKSTVSSPSSSHSISPAIDSARSYSSAPEVEPETPPWRYPTESEARQVVRNAAKLKWSDNFKMVEHEIEKQMQSYRDLGVYEKQRWSSPQTRTILNKAGAKWGNNYDMVLYEVQQQIGARDRLNAKQ